MQRLSFSDPLAFDFIDTGVLSSKSFFETRGIFPWLEERPNSIGECVEWIKNSNNSLNVWSDTDCEKAQKVLCRRDFTISDDVSLGEPELNEDLRLYLFIGAFSCIILILGVLIYIYIKTIQVALKVNKRLKIYQKY